MIQSDKRAQNAVTWSSNTASWPFFLFSL